MGLIFVFVGIAFGLATGVILASLALTYGIVRRGSQTMSIVLCLAGLAIGFSAGFYVFFEHLGGNAASGFTLLDWELWPVVGTALKLAIGSCAIPLIALFLMRKSKASRKDDGGAT